MQPAGTLIPAERRTHMKRMSAREAIIAVSLLVVFALAIWFGAMP